MPSPSPSYVKTLKRNIDVWLKRTENLTDAQIGKLNPKFPHLVRLINQGLAHPETQTEQLALLVKQSYLLVEGYGRWSSWEPLLSKTILKCQSNTLINIELLLHLGKSFYYLNKLEDSLATILESEKNALRLDNEHLFAQCLFHKCMIYRAKREYDNASKFGQDCLTYVHDNEELRRIKAAVLNELGLNSLNMGDKKNLLAAKNFFEDSLEVSYLLSQPILTAKTLINLGVTLKEMNLELEALATYNKAQRILDTTNYELDKIRLLNSLGTCYFKMKKYKEAEVTFMSARSKLVLDLDDLILQASLDQNLGNVLLKQNRLVESEIYLRRGIKLWEQVGESLWIANAYGTLGELLTKKRRIIEAKRSYIDAVQILSSADTQQNDRARRLLREFSHELDSLG